METTIQWNDAREGLPSKEKDLNRPFIVKDTSGAVWTGKMRWGTKTKDVRELFHEENDNRGTNRRCLPWNQIDYWAEMPDDLPVRDPLLHRLENEVEIDGRWRSKEEDRWYTLEKASTNLAFLTVKKEYGNDEWLATFRCSSKPGIIRKVYGEHKDPVEAIYDLFSRAQEATEFFQKEKNKRKRR